MSSRRVFVSALFVLTLAWPLAVGAQGVLAPGRLVSPPLPEGWVLRAAADDKALFQSPKAELRISLGAASPAPAGAAVYESIVAGRWVAGSLAEAADGQKVFVASVKTPKGALLFTAQGKEEDGGYGDALELAAGFRVADDDVPAPLVAPDLSERPEARINPVGLFVTLPNGWRPHLNKKTGVFTMKRKKGGGTMVFSKASGAVLRDLRDAGRVAKAYPGFAVEPLYWKAPGAFRAWRLVGKKDKAGPVIEELHLVRYKKLDEWSYHLVHVKGFTPESGLAPARAVLSRLKIIP